MFLNIEWCFTQIQVTLSQLVQLPFKLKHIKSMSLKVKIDGSFDIWDRRINSFCIAEEEMTKEDEDVMLDNFVTFFIAGKSRYKHDFIPLYVV